VLPDRVQRRAEGQDDQQMGLWGSGAANGVFIVLGQTTSVAMMEGTAGSSSESVVLPAIRDAAAIFQANGGCASS
jgi:hypothetical protein